VDKIITMIPTIKTSPSMLPNPPALHHSSNPDSDIIM
jgi:hypothetical protein